MVAVLRAMALVCGVVAAGSSCIARERGVTPDVGGSHVAEQPEIETRIGPDVGGAMMSLPVEGHNPAVVSVPRGATGRMPVLVATHGAGDRAEWHCEIWRDIVGNRGFVLC